MKITPETAPVGARLLVKYHEAGCLFEVTVLEWLPNGEAVKLLVDEDGKRQWNSLLPASGIIVARLPGGNRSLDDALNAISERYGNDLGAFFDDVKKDLDSRAAGAWREGGDGEC